MNVMRLPCAGCEKIVDARLTDGREIYPHRDDLSDLPFWKCDDCGNYVGCHWKTNERTKPMGVIPTPELRKARQHIHDLIDPIWKSGKVHRNRVYARMSVRLGLKSYHTGNIKSIEEARQVYRVALEVRKHFDEKVQLQENKER